MTHATLHRLPNWPEQFARLVAQRRAAPFAWGQNDCVTFAADAVLAITGHDPAEPAMRQHASAAQALRLQDRLGGLAQIATTALGASVGAQWAAVGDVVLLNVGGRHSLAVCNGATAIAPGPAGLAVADMAAALCCWRVGP